MALCQINGLPVTKKAFLIQIVAFTPHIHHHQYTTVTRWEKDLESFRNPRPVVSRLVQSTEPPRRADSAQI